MAGYIAEENADLSLALAAYKTKHIPNHYQSAVINSFCTFLKCQDVNRLWFVFKEDHIIPHTQPYAQLDTNKVLRIKAKIDKCIKKKYQSMFLQELPTMLIRDVNYIIVDYLI